MIVSRFMGSRSHLCSVLLCVCVCVWVGVSDCHNELISPGVARLRLYISCANFALYCQILGVCPRVPGLSVAPVTGSLVGFLASSWDFFFCELPIASLRYRDFSALSQTDVDSHLCIFWDFLINCLFSIRYWILTLLPCDRRIWPPHRMPEKSL